VIQYKYHNKKEKKVDFETFVGFVTENFNVKSDFAEKNLEKLQDAFYNTEKDVENNGDADLNIDGWWEIALINLEETFKPEGLEV